MGSVVAVQGTHVSTEADGVVRKIAFTAGAVVKAGAVLVQLYTGLVYEGPGLVARIKEHLAGAVRRAGAASIADLAGTQAREWAARPLA